VVTFPTFFFFFPLLKVIVITESLFDKKKKIRFCFYFIEPDTPGGENYDDSETDGSIISETDIRATLNVYKIK